MDIFVAKARFACPHCGKRLNLNEVVEVDEVDLPEDDDDELVDDEGPE